MILKASSSLSLLPLLVVLLHLFIVRCQQDDCNRCFDTNGNACDEDMRRFGKSRYWIKKGQGEAIQTFSEALETCRRYGLTLADISSAADQATFEKLAIYAGLHQYWIAAVNTPTSPGEWTELDLSSPISWQPDEILPPSSNDGAPLAISVDSLGQWKASSTSDQRLGTVCQFPWDSPCSTGYNPLTEPRKSELGARSMTSNSCREPKYQGSQFIRIGPNSKFLYPKYIKTTNSFDAIGPICSQLGKGVGYSYDQALILTTRDLDHILNDFVIAKDLFKKIGPLVTIYTGLRDKNKEAEFVGGKNLLPIQLFPMNSFDYFEPDKDCIGIQCIESLNQCFHKSFACKEKAKIVPMCQYPEYTPCFKNSALDMYRSSLKDELIPLGSTETQSYWGSHFQKSLDNAKAFCAASKLKLLTFSKKEPKVTKQFRDIIIDKYRAAIGLQSFASVSWTSGVFDDSYDKNNNFTFEETGEVWKYTDNEGHFKWIQDSLVQDEDLERCLVVVNSGNNMALRPTVCYMKHFFICQKIRQLPPTTTTTTTTTPSTTTISTTTTPTTTTTEEPEPEAEHIEQARSPEPCFMDHTKLSFPDDGFTSEEVKLLIHDSARLNFSQDYSDHMRIKEETKWRIPHVKGLGAITKAFCPDAEIPKEFINLLMNFIMVYYDSREESVTDPETLEKWKRMENGYPVCLNLTTPLPLYSRGGLVTAYTGDDKNSSIKSPMERADHFPVLDYVLEGFWFMFQVTAGVCYDFVSSRTSWLSEFFFNFKEDFFEMFRTWWTSPGNTNYGVLFGDLDLYSALYNLRACAAAAFALREIEDRLFVRPVRMDETMNVIQDLNERLHYY